MDAGAERRKAWKWSVGLGVVFVAGFMAYSLWWMQDVHGMRAWDVSPDLWITTRVSDYIHYGAYPWLYQAATGYFSLPLMAVLLVPAMVVADHLRLVDGYPYNIAKPSMFLVVGPYSLLFGIFALHAVRKVAWQLGLRARLVLLQLATLAVVLVPCGQMEHPEDVMAFACSCYAVSAADRRSWTRAGLWLGLAVCFKQWAVLAVPFVVLVCPAGRRARTLLASVLPPLLLVMPMLVDDPRNCLRSLLAPFTPVGLIFGHRGILLIVAGADASRWARGGAVVAAVLLAVWLSRRRPDLLVDGIGAAFLLRALAEPLIFPYYVCPGLALLLLAAVRRKGRLEVGDVAAVVLAALWALPAAMGSGLWWGGEAVSLSLMFLQLYVLGRPGRHRHLRPMTSHLGEAVTSSFSIASGGPVTLPIKQPQVVAGSARAVGE